MRCSKLYSLLCFLLGSLTCGLQVFSQNLFLEECFVGGVTAAGRTSAGLLDGHFKIKWEQDYILKDAYVLTYRYGRPISKPFIVNDMEFAWSDENQIGEELLDNENAEYFAVHAQRITDLVMIQNDSVNVYLNGADATNLNLGQGWWSLQFVFLYTSPLILDSTCVRIYTASQPQTELQSYLFDKPDFKSGTDIGFSIYSDRLNIFFEDRTRIGINDQILGNIWGYDNINPVAAGVRGHFYYENGELFGLDDDTANTEVNRSDGIAVINDYLDDQLQQELYLNPVNADMPQWGYNPHPAFFIVYAPNCSVTNIDMPRSYSFCRFQATPKGEPDYTDTIQLAAIPGFDNYEWTPASGLSNSTIANPLCFADSSGWYRVRMWNDDEGGACSQTIPVFVTVGKVPRPGNLQVRASFCPQNTGRIIFGEMDGKAPFQYTVNGNTKTNGTFENLTPGIYDVSVTDALGCTWDSTAVVALDPLQTAAFTANPDSGYSPLRVVLTNQSTEATDYTWMVNGTPFSNSTNTSYTFTDTGTYVIALIAIRNETSCADTAYATIRVDQGLKIVVPNIITPNGDGRNDALVAQTAGVAYMRWEIRNRWGNLLHTGEATSPPPALTLWSPGDGDYPDGVYTILVTVKGESGEMREFAAQVTLASL